MHVCLITVDTHSGMLALKVVILIYVQSMQPKMVGNGYFLYPSPERLLNGVDSIHTCRERKTMASLLLLGLSGLVVLACWHLILPCAVILLCALSAALSCV